MTFNVPIIISLGNGVILGLLFFRFLVSSLHIRLCLALKVSLSELVSLNALFPSVVVVVFQEVIVLVLGSCIKLTARS